MGGNGSHYETVISKVEDRQLSFPDLQWGGMWFIFCQEDTIFWDWDGDMKWSEVTQSCPALCDPMDCRLPGSSVHRIFQARILKWVAISFPRGSSWPRGWTWVSYTAESFFTHWATRADTDELGNWSGFNQKGAIVSEAATGPCSDSSGK